MPSRCIVDPHFAFGDHFLNAGAAHGLKACGKKLVQPLAYVSWGNNNRDGKLFDHEFRRSSMRSISQLRKRQQIGPRFSLHEGRIAAKIHGNGSHLRTDAEGFLRFLHRPPESQCSQQMGVSPARGLLNPVSWAWSARCGDSSQFPVLDRLWSMGCIGQSFGGYRVGPSLVECKEPIRETTEGERHSNHDAGYAGIHLQWNGGSAETGWANYIRWLESDTELLLYTSPACFNILPKRSLLPEQLAEVRTRLSKNISSPHSK